MKQEDKQPTLADEALFARMLSVQVTGAIQQAHVDGKMDRETYDKLFELARKAEAQIGKLAEILEQKGPTP